MNKKILIADDVSSMRWITKNLLRDMEFNNTIQADDGLNALPILNASGIDFLVTD